MQTQDEITQSENDALIVKRPWQTPDFTELACEETANGDPPITGPGDGINAYS